MVLSKRPKQLLQCVSTTVKKDHLLSSVILSPYLLRAIRGNLFDSFFVVCRICHQKLAYVGKLIKVNSNALNPIQERPFSGCSRIGGRQKGPSSLKSVTHVLQKWNLPQLYLSYKRPKIIGIPSHALCVLLTSAFFFIRNQQILLYEKIQIQIKF